jgi:hypothetical protein
MKKIVSCLLAVVCFGTVPVFAQSISEKLSGEWTVTQIALDMNGNKQADKNEQANAASLGLYIKLNADGTGTSRMDMFSVLEDRLKWSMGNNNTEINFSGEGNQDKKILSYRVADARNSMHVDKFSGNTLQLSSNEAGMMWITLKRK